MLAISVDMVRLMPVCRTKLIIVAKTPPKAAKKVA